MELIKGKWYKNLGRLKDHIGKFSGWHDLEIISVSEYIYEDKLRGPSEWFTKDYKFAEECPLSEIQQYLPDGHPDKEYVLPEKWCVKDCEEVSKWASKVFGCGYLVNSSAYLCVDKKEFPNFNSYFFYYEDSARSYTEITFEQFKKYVLKTKEMEEREIVGYKLKDNKYTKNVKALLNAPEFDFQEFEDNRFKFTIALKELRGAGVLDLWFEPVFKEKFKVGDWVMETWASSPYYNLKAFRIIRINDEIATYNRQGECKITLSNLRLATPEEIKKTLVEEAIKRGFKGGVKIKTCFPDYSPVYTSDRSYKMNDCLPEYEQYLDALRMGGSIIYHKGKWAEILPSYPQVEINGYKGEFFDWGVKFGCAEIDKDVFIRLGQLGQGLNRCNKALESVTIGKGTFSKEQIKLIADYYLNKK